MMLPWESSRDVVWYSVSQFSARHRYSPRTVRLWCANGTMLKRGCRVWRDQSARWWIGESLNDTDTVAAAMSATL